MDSREIFRQYMMGAMKASSAISELGKLLIDVSSRSKQQEAARARYVIGFIRRHIQYKTGDASAKDLCLNIRDIVLVLGRVSLNEKLYSVVKQYGASFDLVCENDYQVSCLMHFPEWLLPNKYIQDVYSLQNPDFTMSDSSSGDELLRNNTIFNEYKSFEQKIAVHTAINLPLGQTLLVSQPTGGGKSLVTQMLASTSEGLTLVIVPTVALARDQFHAAEHNLKDKNGIYCYRGTQTDAERQAIITSIKDKTARILFISPEAILMNLQLYGLLDKAASNGYLVNVVVDEAHIVPDWGVFFRPDFQIFSIALRKWRNLSKNTIRTFLLSATLSDDVVDTLFSLFGSENGNSQVRCDSLRQEPRFYFCSTKSKKEQDDKTVEAIKLLPKPAVVYVLEPREAKDLQKRLRTEGYKNIPIFTGITNDEERDKILLGWKNQEYDIVIATSAFGIGVDKPDVRSIIHACCPENLSRFYQEVGRGGRDGLPSISLFLPYQSKDDKNADVRRALGLVKSRVLTVERSVIRWNGMLSNRNAIIDADECVLDTSATPSTMSEEEAEYAGNRNVAWNVNLLLFLHRIGFIDLLDASFVPEKKAYTVKVKLLRTDVLGDSERLSEALVEPRENEFQSQMKGYYIIRDLVASPKSACWGRTFKHLFPLSREVCNGCPSDPDGRVTTDTKFKLRIPPAIQLPPSEPSRKLSRKMSPFTELIVRRNSSGKCTSDEVSSICERACEYDIGCVVIPGRFTQSVSFNGLVLDYDEFFFAVKNSPYLFSRGVLCVFEEDANTNYSLYKNLCILEEQKYRRVLYCNDNDVISTNGKPIRESIDCYSISVDKF